MSYALPKPFAPLREYLRGLGADVNHFASARQAAFMAQQLLGTRIKFPPQGGDMTSTLFLIQAELEAGRTSAKKEPQPPAKKGQKGGRSLARQADHVTKFTPDVFSAGVHIFCDGAAIPNPGAGGWGFVVYRDSVVLGEWFGGQTDATNNQMEMTGLLNAIEWARCHVQIYGPATIWSDSQYCVEGVNDWMPKWKARGWSKRKLNSPKREEGEIKNLELWQAIDAALQNLTGGQVMIKWVKGHVGVAGNERADELAEQGREQVEMRADLLTSSDDLDQRYRQIMGAA